jgi:hypothetical protein
MALYFYLLETLFHHVICNLCSPLFFLSFSEQAAILTQQAEVKRAHHIADFLPKEELEKFEQKVKAVKTGTPDPLYEDYAQNKLDQNNIGFKMLMKQGWQAGTGLGKTGDGVVAPVNK